MKKKFFIITILISLFSSLNTFAWPESPTVNAKSYIVYNNDSHTSLYEKDVDLRINPYEFNKFVLALVVAEECEDIDEMFTFTNTALSSKLITKNSSIISAQTGDKLSIKDGLYCLILHQADDVAVALSEKVAGSINDGAKLMNNYAKRLGCTNTNFTNVTGAYDINQYTTARDMLKIYEKALENDLIIGITKSMVYTHAPIKRFPNAEDTNNQVYQKFSMLRKASSNYYDGIESGFVSNYKTSHNVMLSAQKNGMTLIGIILGGDKTYIKETKLIMNSAFSNFKNLSVTANDKTYSGDANIFRIDNIPMLEFSSLEIMSNSYVCIPKSNKFSELTSKISYTSEENKLKNNAVAKLEYFLNQKLVGIAYITGKDSTDSSVSYIGLQSQGTLRDMINQDSVEISNSPIYYDYEKNRLVVSEAVVTVLKIFSIIILLIFLYVYIKTMFIDKQRADRNSGGLTKRQSRKYKNLFGNKD